MGIEPISAVGREEQEQAEGQYSEPLAKSLNKLEESRTSLADMIRDAKDRADQQREKFRLTKTAPRYGDAPLEAYARLSRAHTPSQAGAAAGYARRRLVQLEAAQRSDPEHSDQIRAAVSQLKKAVGRANRKKLELTREQLALARQKRLARENRRREEQRIRQQLRRAQAMRSIRESGYFQEAEIANRQADQLAAARLELRLQAEQLGAGATRSVDAAVQGYSVSVQTAQGGGAESPRVDVQA